MWETVDPDGRRVVLTFARWRHIVQRHPELSRSREAILQAIRFPETSRPGYEPNEEWFYRHGFGPGRWIRVVVHYHHGVGSITTAFPRRSLP